MLKAHLASIHARLNGLVQLWLWQVIGDRHVCHVALPQVSKAAYGLCCWVRAMEVYDRVAKVVGPKKEALKQAEAQLEVSLHRLTSLSLALSCSRSVRFWA